jgi:hypothetical protein
MSTDSAIDTPGSRFLADAASSSGACYLGLNDLSLAEIAALCSNDEAAARIVAREALSRMRVDQYFNPPTDELLLTALSLTRRNDPEIVRDIHEVAVSLAHVPVPNVIVPQTDYGDPVATARALASIGAIEYAAEVRVAIGGREIVHRISKTAQENFVIRLLKTLDLAGIAKAIIHGLKGGN